MNIEEWIQALLLVLVTVVILTLLVLSSKQQDVPYTKTIKMPDGTVQSCTFIGYGRLRTLLECEDSR